MSILLDGASVFISNWQLITGILALTIVPILLIVPRFKSDLKPASTSTGILLALIIISSLLLRLAFVSKALFPSYFDSAQHYAMIKNIMAGDASLILGGLQTSYYHMGFHFLTAFLASVFQTEIKATMLILGQVILAVMPLTFFFIIRYATQSTWAGMFAVILSALGWYMPSHAVDWGKYPALMSLSLIPLVLSLAYWLGKKNDMELSWKRILLYTLFGASILVTAFVHSRSLIVIVIALIAWIVSDWWMKLHLANKRLILFVLLGVILSEIIVVQRHGVMSLLFDPYLNKGILTTSLVVLLSVFAYKEYPQLTFSSLLTICLLVVSLFIPVNGFVPGRTNLTLMDRPYVEMILFIPLSFLGGLGFAGLEKWIKNSYQRYALLIGIGLVLMYAIINHQFYPSDCCVIVGNDDVAAIVWMEDQLPVEARIGIASTELRVIAADVVEAYVGADAGIWVTPLIGRHTITLPHTTEFDQQEMLDLLCAEKIGYLFVGELGQPFDVTRLEFRPTWYRPLLLMPGTRVYEVVGCEKLSLLF
ncbi:MAG TPA: hypothetical protein DCX53_15430 [Anaerolineae bacterium]|nr:hypothetical protein [Anaerolineae bacterium]